MFRFLARILSPPETRALDINSAWALIDFGRQTASSIAVTPETAWRCPIVRGAISILSESLAQLPLLDLRGRRRWIEDPGYVAPAL